ncbi:hypothetical protein TNCV_1105221 [Trichonephila clavipes]|nr:hypothetical protein TNCV_1105221 [Trichonephila clavipes]
MTKFQKVFNIGNTPGVTEITIQGLLKRKIENIAKYVCDNENEDLKCKYIRLTFDSSVDISYLVVAQWSQTCGQRCRSWFDMTGQGAKRRLERKRTHSKQRLLSLERNPRWRPRDIKSSGR